MTASDCHSLFSYQYPFCHPRFFPSVILAPPLLSSSTLVIEDPVSLPFPSHTPQPWIPAFAGMTEGKAGMTAREKAGMTEREKAGMTEREKAGMTEREKVGMTEREKAGMTEREKAGMTAREKNRNDRLTGFNGEIESRLLRFRLASEYVSLFFPEFLRGGAAWSCRLVFPH